MPDRDLPISLQGIQKVLRYLDKNEEKLCSIRTVSRNTDLSMRVAKNVLIHLENLGQVERVVEENKVVPKWKITKFGREVVKKAKETKKIPSAVSDKKTQLLATIQIPTEIEEIRNKISLIHEQMGNTLKSIQANLSQTLGAVMNLNDPPFEDLMGLIVKRIKTAKLTLQNLPKDPTKQYQLRKIGEKQKKLKDKDKKVIFTEILFITHILLNQINIISRLGEKLTRFMENEAISHAYSIAQELRQELRIIFHLINQRNKIKPNSHLLNEDEVEAILENNITVDLLDKIIEHPLTHNTKQKAIKEAVLNILNLVNKGQKTLNDHILEIKENIPLYTLYQLILDEKPALRFTIEELEQAINSLADEGYIPGIKVIEQDEEHFFKVVQLKAHDLSKEENEIISAALELEKFSLMELTEKLGWKKEKIIKILEDLTEVGILRHTRSYLHGNQWYIVSQKE